MPDSTRSLASALAALHPAVGRLLASEALPPVAEAVERGYFTPGEEEHLFGWFARFLTLRSELWSVVEELSRELGKPLAELRGDDEWRTFLVGYGAACSIVRLDRFLVESLATHRLTQRKVNEGDTARRIPRKQFTAVFASFTEPRNALRMESAMRVAGAHREEIAQLRDDEEAGWIVERLPELEAALDPSRRRYAGWASRFGWHAWARRGASARQRGLFVLLEASGRWVASSQLASGQRRLSAALRAEIASLLRPGDVLVTRRDGALSNLFLPGYWPHAALHLGSEADRERLGVRLDPARASRWCGDRRVLEALKDGVRFRPLEETLGVDAVAVIRPLLAEAELTCGLERAAEHEGKLYNFDFDFFRSDRLVCTEVVYRAFDGLGGVRIPLRERADRPTLSAEDLLELALADEGFTPVAVAGAPGCERRVATDVDEVAEILDRSLRPGRDSG